MVANQAMDPRVEQELGRLLLTELLAYQLASPVKWIETQDELFSRQKIQRLVEIGPGDTLATMARKTLIGQQDKHDAAVAARRKLLYYQKDQKELRYETDPVEKPAKPAAAPAAPTPAPAAAAPAAAAPAAPAPAVASAAPAAAIADSPVSAKDIVIAIVASKLQKTFGSLQTDQTIKQLSGGRSTVENEIVGDLGAEISTLPEKPEELSIESLGAELQTSSGYSGQLKKTTGALVARFFSLKMPGGFGAAQVRSYLQDRWGLGSGRQDSVVLRAAASQPAARLGSEAEAKAFFDTMAQEYAKAYGLDLSAASAGGNPAAAGNGAAVQLDPAALAAMNKDKLARRKTKIDFLSKLYGLDPNKGDEVNGATKKLIDSLQGKLDGLYAELGDPFATGIQPIWSAQKVRKFDSSWNWVMQDLYDTFYSIMNGDVQPAEDELHTRSILLANRSDARMLRAARHFLEKKYDMDPERVASAKQFLQEVVDKTAAGEKKPYVAFDVKKGLAPHTELGEKGRIDYSEVPRQEKDLIPEVWLESSTQSGWKKDAKLTKSLFSALDDAQTSGLSFSGKTVLLTGTGRGSIGAEIVKGLLNGGARIVVTTSSYNPKTVRWYQSMYTAHGAAGSQLIVVPFNQGSQQDLNNVVDYIYDTKNGLGWDLDHVVPFAAISENGREVDGIDSKSELAHRVMLTNVVRLLGAIKKNKHERGFNCQPTQVILPLSPNHGVFGNDGLYAESKISLETLANKWASESWADYLCICGAAIGWTRGTALMASNDIMAAGIEKLGMRTFSQPEMAFYILLLMGRTIYKLNEIEPVYADLTGGMSVVPNLKEEMTRIQQNIADTTSISISLHKEEAAEAAIKPAAKQEELTPQANLQFNYPALGAHDEACQKVGYNLNGMIDLEKVVVVTGFSEVGPWGNARTRWEMESYGQFSVEGCVEMAWIMGFITHHDGVVDGKHYVGWVDAKTKKPVRDCDVKTKYEEEILQHTGIRVIEPELDDEWDPSRRQFLQEVILDDDLPMLQVPKDLALDFQREHGEKVDVHEVPGTDGEECSVKLKKGAVLLIPKALGTTRRIAGHIPQGWDAKTYGISDDIISQVDRITLFALVSTAESLVNAGITDSYEMYKYLHVSEIGNCVSSGMGGAKSLKAIHKTRYMDKEVQSDILQESFINTVAAWINMLLMSAAGPIRTPVGACATALESLETGYETILSGKAKMCLVGGFDDLTEMISSEFDNMKVTTNDIDEAARGREPKESSRPTATTRSGFVESQGGGVQVITTAKLALDMGMPIHAIIAYAGSAGDKAGRSVPAAGKGILVNAREVPSKQPSPLLDLSYRQRRMNIRKQQIQANMEAELELLHEDEEAAGDDEDAAEQIKLRAEDIRADAARQMKEATNTLGNEFWHGKENIAPLRGALAVWGLTIDDLDFASFHGTSTKNNDTNETEVIQTQLTHLGRNPGNPILGIFQKYMTGHAKGGAGAFMLNGCLQVLDSGIVPGNRNADNIDAALRKNELIVFPNRTIHTPGLRAFSISSFGFGQKGAQAIGVHPRYLYAAMPKEQYEAYSQKRRLRHRQAARHFHKSMATNTVFVAKESAPYRKDQEVKVLLNGAARMQANGEQAYKV